MLLNFLVLLCLVIYSVHFKYVEIHSAYGFIVVVCGFHLFVYFKTREKASLEMIYATVALLCAVYTFNRPIILHTFSITATWPIFSCS